MRERPSRWIIKSERRRGRSVEFERQIVTGWSSWSSFSVLWMCAWTLIACQEPPRAFNEGGGNMILPPLPDTGIDGGVAGNTPTDTGVVGGEAGEEGQAGVGGELVDMEPLDMEPERDAAAFDPIPFAVETRVGLRNTEAGVENRVTCELLDQEAQPISAPNLRVELVPSQGFDRTEIGVIGEVARTFEVTCIAPEYGLVDSTPALWTVIPSNPALTFATLFKEGARVERVEAGSLVTVECEAFDGYGNPADAIFSERIEPAGLGVERVGPAWRFNRAGLYDVYCDAPGVEDARPSQLEVTSGLPRRLTLTLDPDRPVFQAGQVVTVNPQAFDAQDNPVREVSYRVWSEPELEPFGTRRFRLDTLGDFTIYAEVISETENDQELIGSVDLQVDFGGPGIRCDWPELGDVVTVNEGGTLTLSGQASDLIGLQSISVDGVPVVVDDEGNFESEVNVSWGLNLHEVVAEDADGTSSAFCAYFAAPSFLREALPLTDALTLYLGQAVVDDGAPSQPLRSIGDVLRRVINSVGLRDSVHSAASAQNPIVPTECRARVLGICLFRFGVTYEDFRISRDNQLSLTLLDDALRVRVSLRDIAVVAKLQGTLGNRATISTSGITVDITFNTGLGVGGRPNISVRAVNEVTVNRLDSDFSGFITGFILELAFSAFEGLIRDTVTNTIRGFLERELDNTLTGLFSDTSVGDLGTGFNIPHPLGGEITLQLIGTLSRLDWSPQGIVLGLSTRFDGPSVVAVNSPGTPRLPEGPLPFPNGDSVGGAVKLTVLNQALHRLWRAGFLELNGEGLVASLGVDLPAGAEVTLQVAYPPFVEGVDGQSAVRLALGPLRATVRYPGFFEEPFPVQLAAILTASVRLQGERDLSFEGVEVERIVFSLGSSVPATARRILEDTLRGVVQRVADDALNSALPVLPLPELTIPSGFEQFDLPPTTRLGLRGPTLTGDRALWRLSGQFGEP